MIQPDKLLVTRRYFGAEMVEACRVHDMMLEAMLSKSRVANFVTLVGRQYGGGLPHGKVRRLPIHGSDDDHHSGAKKMKVQQRHGIEALNLQHIRSLTVFQLEGQSKLLVGDQFKLLRVLDLENCNILKNKHMRYVCRLHLLRFLRLRGTKITEMPSKISDLEYLETLDFDSWMIYTMPSTVTKLRRLECLRVYQWILPRGLGNMKALREVDWARLKGDVEVAREIGEPQQLQVLYISVAETGEEFLCALGSSLSKTCALRSLNLSTGYGMTLDFLLHVSTPPPLLRCLTMQGAISRFPDWISSLKHLSKLSVGQSGGLAVDQVLDSLCKLPSLQSIQLERWSCGQQQLVARTTHNFPALRVLKLDLAGDHPEVVIFEQRSMTKLETLLLEFSNRDKSIVGIDNLENLREVKLKGNKNNPLEHEVEKNLESLREVLTKRAVEQNLGNHSRETLLECAVHNLQDLTNVLWGRTRAEQNSGNLRQFPLEHAVLDNVIREVMLKGKENKSLGRVLKQLEDMNKERPETNQIKVVVEYL